MQISNIYESIIVMKSIDTRFFRNVLKLFKKLVAHVLSGLNNTDCLHVTLEIKRKSGHFIVPNDTRMFHTNRSKAPTKNLLSQYFT